MKIEVGKHAGFCRGVKEAINKTFTIARESDRIIYTDGELIHNPQTLKMLESSNVRILEGSEDLKNETVIIRAHGVSPERRLELKKKSKNLKNFTCRDVARVQSSIKKWTHKGYSVIIFGKKEHPEVIGLLGYAENGFVVNNKQDIKKLPNLKKVFIVSQTTMDLDSFSEISELLRKKYNIVEIENTICTATELRQNEVKELSKRNDCLLVIGGKNSSNTKRLYEIATKYTTAYFVERIEDLDKIDFTGIKNLGITAGASTPDWLISEFIEELYKRNRSLFPDVFMNIINFSLHSKLIASFGAFILSFAVADNLNVPFSFSISLLVSFYYLSMSLMNSFTNRFSFKIDNPGSYRFISRFKYVFLSLFIFSIIEIIYIAFTLGDNILILTLFSLILGVVYNLSFLPLQGVIKKIMSFREWDLLSLKSIVLAFAVTILLNGLYVLYTYPDIWDSLFKSDSFLQNFGFYFSVYYIFILMFTRQILFEMKSAQTDRLAGVSSILNIMSKEKVIKLLYILPLSLLLFMIIGIITTFYPIEKGKYFVAVIYNLFLLSIALKKQVFHNRTRFEFVIESNLFVAGMISFL